MNEDIFIKWCNRPPKNSKLWPKAKKPGYELVFKPYGYAGAGFYLQPIREVNNAPIRS